MDQNIFTEIAIAEKFKVSTSKLRKDRRAGTGLPFLRIGRCIRYSLDDIMASEVIRVTPRRSSGADPEDCKICGLALWAEVVDFGGNRVPCKLGDDHRLCPRCGRPRTP